MPRRALDWTLLACRSYAGFRLPPCGCFGVAFWRPCLADWRFVAASASAKPSAATVLPRGGPHFPNTLHKNRWMNTIDPSVKAQAKASPLCVRNMVPSVSRRYSKQTPSLAIKNG